MSQRNWIVVADRAGARIFANDTGSTELSLVEELPHPEGRLKNRGIDTDKPGRSFDRKGSGRHHMEVRQEPTEHLAESFARELTEHCRKARQEGRFDALFMVAPAHFLGLLRHSLDPATAAVVRGTVDKELTQLDEKSLAERLGSLLSP